MTNNRKISLITLACILVAALIAALTLFSGVIFSQAERKVTLTGNNYFYTANEAELNDYYSQSDGAYYISFVFASDDGAVTYRKNLALNWYSASEDDATDGVPGFLSTEIGFDSLTFQTFTIKFQSQQYTKTKDGVTSNYITFVADTENDCVYAVIGDEYELAQEDIDDQLSELRDSYTALAYDKITISFTEYAFGVYTVEVLDGASNTQEGEFKNMAAGYSKYVSSSSSTSVIPLTYSAQFAEGNEDVATMVLYSFNGQSFEVTGTEGTHIVSDNMPPVLCLTQDVTTLRYGYAVDDFDYAVVDMLATSPKSTINYYVLQNSQAEGDNDLNDTENGYYTAVSSSDPSPVIRGTDAYKYDDVSAAGYTTECLVKIYVSIQDSTATGYTSDIVYLDWYVDSSYLATVNGCNFIKATTDNQGVTYSYTGSDTSYSTTTEMIAAIQNAYQELVYAAIAEQEVTAGDGNYFYLPSFEGFISDNTTAYNNLTFSIYYISSSTGSSTALSYNQLAIEVEEEGLYTFVIYATDEDGNSMYYIDDEYNVVKFEASELTDLLSDSKSNKLSGYVPLFSFTVKYVGLSVEDPEAQSIGYVGTTYTASSFDITGLASKYTATYTLFLFDRQAYTEDYGAITYSQFVKIVSELFSDAESRAKYFTTIKALSDMEETDADYELYSDYAWDPDSLSFVPQDDNAFYVIVLSAKDNVYQTKSVTSCMAISVSAAADTLKGESDWLSKNIASVVLLIIAGLSLIGIILLIFIKPKEKGDIDVIDENETKKKSTRKKVNKNSAE